MDDDRITQILVRRLQLRALDGDLAAAALLLSREIPTLKAVSQAKTIELPDTDVVDQSAAVLKLIRTGQIGVDEGLTLIRAMETTKNIAIDPNAHSETVINVQYAQMPEPDPQVITRPANGV